MVRVCEIDNKNLIVAVIINVEKSWVIMVILTWMMIVIIIVKTMVEIMMAIFFNSVISVMNNRHNYVSHDNGTPKVK